MLTDQPVLSYHLQSPTTDFAYRNQGMAMFVVSCGPELCEAAGCRCGFQEVSDLETYRTQAVCSKLARNKSACVSSKVQRLLVTYRNALHGRILRSRRFGLGLFGMSAHGAQSQDAGQKRRNAHDEECIRMSRRCAEVRRRRKVSVSCVSSVWTRDAWMQW